MNKKVVITGLTLATFALSAASADAAELFQLDKSSSYSTFHGEGGCGEGGCGEGSCGHDKKDKKTKGTEHNRS